MLAPPLAEVAPARRARLAPPVQDGFREMLDLRMCLPRSPVEVQLLREIVVNDLGPEKTSEAREQMISRWKTVARGLFFEDVDLEQNTIHKWLPRWFRCIC